MKRAFVGALLAAGAAASCVSLTPKGSAVRITTNPEVVRGCDYLGNVSGNSTTWNLVGNPYGQPGGGDVQNAENELRNRAGSMGADVVYINTQNAWRVVGEAYSCDRLLQQRGDTRYRVYTLLEELGKRGGEFEPLQLLKARQDFYDVVEAGHPTAAQITSEYLARLWLAHRPASESRRAPDQEFVTYLNGTLDRLAARGGEFASLGDPAMRHAFVKHLAAVNPAVADVTQEYLERLWLAFRARSLGAAK